MTRLVWLTFFSSVLATSLAVSQASAQTYGTDYISFKGEGVILDSPINAACTPNFASFNRIGIVYRFTANPSLIADALTFVSEGGSVFRILSTNGPGFSLNGASPTSFTLINRFSNFANGTNSSNLTISSGINTAVTLGTGNIKIVGGQITNWFNIAGCDITNFHAAAVSIPQ